MVPTQTLETYPPFGDNATKVQPDNAKYAAGFQPADVYPAEWVNWAWGKNTRCITDLNAGVNMMEKEINNVLDGAGKTPDATKENQLLQSIQKLISDAETRAKLAAHPIGSLYWSSDSTDPGTLFGGTWARIKDKFILAAGDTYTNGNTGGAATVTLTTNNMPSHSHTIGGSTGATQPTFSGSAVTSGANNRGHTHTGPSHQHVLNNGNTSSAGTTTTAGFRGVAVTSGAMSQHSSGSFDIRKTDIGNVIVAQDGVVFTASDVGSDYSQVWSKSTSDKARRMTLNIAHTHSVTASGYIYGKTDAAGTGNTGAESQDHTHSVTASGTVSSHTHTLPANTGSSGGGTAVDKMPPYLVKYCWERVS